MGNSDVALLKPGKETSFLTESLRIPVFEDSKVGILKGLKHLFIALTESNFFEKDFFKKISPLRNIRMLFLPQNKIDQNFFTQSLISSGYDKYLKKVFWFSDPTVPKRIMKAWDLSAEEELIADAEYQNGALSIMNCKLSFLKVDIEKIPALRKMTPEQLKSFKIEEFGSYIYWEAAGREVHLDFEAFKAVSDKEMAEKQKIEKKIHDSKIGSSIALIRKECGLKQKDFEPEISAKEMGRIERGEVFPRVETLRKMGKKAGFELQEFLIEIGAKSSIS